MKKKLTLTDKIHAKLRRKEMPVHAGRGAGFHKNKKKYTRKNKHKRDFNEQ